MFDHHGLVKPSTHAAQAKLSRWTRSGQAQRIFPGVYATPEAAAHPHTLIRAAQLWCPGSIVTGRAAARMTYWPELQVSRIDLLAARSHAPHVIRLHRRSLDPSWVVDLDGCRVTHPSFTAALLCGEPDGEEHAAFALRQGVSFEDMLAAPLSGWPHGTERRRVLRLFRHKAWSIAEVRAHQLLRRAGIVGWTANVEIRTRWGRYFGDIVFPRHRVVIEIDGYEFHSGRDAFERDRERHNALTAAGWRVLHLTWSMIDDGPGFLATVRSTLRCDWMQSPAA